MISRGCVLGASDSAVNSLFLSLPLPPNNLRAWVVLAARIAAALTPPRRMLLLTVLALFLYIYKNGQRSSKKGKKRIFLPNERERLFFHTCGRLFMCREEGRGGEKREKREREKKGGKRKNTFKFKP